MKRILVFLLLAVTLMISGCSGPTGMIGESPSPAPEGALATAMLTPAPTIVATAKAQSSYPPSSYTREESLEFLAEQEAPDFTLELLTGGEASLSDYRGKIVFLSFWQTWCGPCRDEMPHFEAMMQENEDVVVLAVNALPGEGSSRATAEKDVRAFIEKGGYTFPVLLDKDGSVFDGEAYRSQYIPANYVIDREGVLRVAMQGSFSEDALATVLDVMRGLDW